MSKKKLDGIGQLIEVSDKCLTLHPRVKLDGSLKEYPCNCRENVKKILRREFGVKS